jgi:uncharacterized protein (DUF433 family)
LADTPLFTFDDVVGLRVVSILRNEHRIPLQELRRIGAWLRRYADKPWSGLRLFVSGRRIYFSDPKTGVPIGAERPGQAALSTIELQRIADDASERVLTLRRRRTLQYGKIERRRGVQRNAPRVSGTRIPIAAIGSFHREGFSIDQIVREYPTLTKADVRNAIELHGGRRKSRTR